MAEVDNVVGAAIQEMADRMADPERRAAIPDHVLIRFLSEANEVEKRREAKAQKEEQELKERTVLQIVRESSLPSDRKRNLVMAEVTRLVSLLEELEKELETL